MERVILFLIVALAGSGYSLFIGKPIYRKWKSSQKFSNTDYVHIFIITTIFIVAVGILFSPLIGKSSTQPTNSMPVQNSAPTSNTNTQFYVPTPTEVITTIPTYTPIPTPVASIGAELYSISDWSKGMSGWSSVDGWKTVDNMLVNDGSNYNGWMITPFTPFKADYAVEAQLQFIRKVGYDGESGIVVRGGEDKGYFMGFHSDGFAQISARYVRGVIEKRSFNTGTDWHTYRAEVVGNKIQLLIDGTLIIELIDNQFLDAGQIGLWCHGLQVNVRSFKVINL